MQTLFSRYGNIESTSQTLLNNVSKINYYYNRLSAKQIFSSEELSLKIITFHNFINGSKIIRIYSYNCKEKNPNLAFTIKKKN